tara:strand:+ start:3082 stop:3291 length:210 start_codon:yes stop_codon:yes gene_type:complete
MINLRDKLKNAIIAHAKGEIEVHLANVDVFLNNPVGIGDHSNVTEAIQSEIDKIAGWDHRIEVIKKYVK